MADSDFVLQEFIRAAGGPDATLAAQDKQSGEAQSTLRASAEAQTEVEVAAQTATEAQADPILDACGQLAAAMDVSSTTTKEVCERRLVASARLVLEELTSSDAVTLVAAATHFLAQTAAAGRSRDDLSWFRPCLLVLLELADPTVKPRASAFPLLRMVQQKVSLTLEAGPAAEPAAPPAAPRAQAAPPATPEPAQSWSAPSTWRQVGEEWFASEMSTELLAHAGHLHVRDHYPRFWCSADGRRCRAILRFGRGALGAEISSQTHGDAKQAFQELLRIAAVVPAECKSLRSLLEELLPDAASRPQHWEVYICS